jgi:hypothetical protein
MGPDVEDELRRMTDEDREFYALLDVVYYTGSEEPCGYLLVRPLPRIP